MFVVNEKQANQGSLCHHKEIHFDSSMSFNVLTAVLTSGISIPPPPHPFLLSAPYFQEESISLFLMTHVRNPCLSLLLYFRQQTPFRVLLGQPHKSPPAPCESATPVSWGAVRPSDSLSHAPYPPRPGHASPWCHLGFSAPGWATVGLSLPGVPRGVFAQQQNFCSSGTVPQGCLKAFIQEETNASIRFSPRGPLVC